MITAREFRVGVLTLDVDGARSTNVPSSTWTWSKDAVEVTCSTVDNWRCSSSIGGGSTPQPELSASTDSSIGLKKEKTPESGSSASNPPSEGSHTSLSLPGQSVLMDNGRARG